MTARALGFGVAALVFVVDQAVKWFVTGPLGIDQVGLARTLLPIFDLRFVPNVGVSLGLLPAGGPAMRWGLVVLTGAIAVAVTVWMLREKARADVAALGLVLGGALGNILDRVRFGHVVDFADLHFHVSSTFITLVLSPIHRLTFGHLVDLDEISHSGLWRPFLVFNVADAAITIGVAVLLLRALLIRDGAHAGRPKETT